MKSSLKPLSTLTTISTPTKRNALMNTAFSRENNNILQKNMSWLRNHCEHLVQDEIMEMLSQLTKVIILYQFLFFSFLKFNSSVNHKLLKKSNGIIDCTTLVLTFIIVSMLFNNIIIFSYKVELLTSELTR